MYKVLIVTLLMFGTWLSTNEGMPGTFPECVVQGGAVRMAEHDVDCRYVETSTLRTYLTGTTTCGEEVYFDAWGETRNGVVTHMFELGRIEVLPEVTDDGVPEMPMPCLNDPEDGGA